MGNYDGWPQEQDVDTMMKLYRRYKAWRDVRRVAKFIGKLSDDKLKSLAKAVGVTITKVK